jgi:hypothetical protein
MVVSTHLQAQSLTDANKPGVSWDAPRKVPTTREKGRPMNEQPQARAPSNNKALAKQHYERARRLNYWASQPDMPRSAAEGYREEARFHFDMARHYLMKDKAE